MALLKSKNGNDMYSWKSDDIRDAEISAINDNGCCNVFAIDNPILLTGVNISNNGIINTSTDSIPLFNFIFRAFVSDSPIMLANDNINEIGNYTFNVTIPNNAQRLMFKHDGANQDLAITIPSVPAGNYNLTFTVVSHDPTTVGGLVISNIMLYDARLSPTGYVPYAKTNKQLTNDTAAIEAILDVYGAKNKWNVESNSLYGVTFENNGKNGIHVSGSLDYPSHPHTYNTCRVNLPYGTYRAYGMPESCSLIKFKYNHADGTQFYIPENGIITDEISELILWIEEPGNIDEIIYPMFCDARITDSTYVPYAMTNKELTDRVTWKHLGYGADDGGEVATSINYSEFMFTMNIADTALMQSIIVPRDQIYHAIFVLAYQDTVHSGQTRIEYNSSLSKFTFQREFLHGWNAVRIDIYGR